MGTLSQHFYTLQTCTIRTCIEVDPDLLLPICSFCALFCVLCPVAEHVINLNIKDGFAGVLRSSSFTSKYQVVLQRLYCA